LRTLLETQDKQESCLRKINASGTWVRRKKMTSNRYPIKLWAKTTVRVFLSTSQRYWEL